MHSWNSHVAEVGHTEWRYTRLANFKRDAQQTRRRLLSPEYRPITEREQTREENDREHDHDDTLA